MTLDEMVAIARRYDTQMSRALLHAAGETQRPAMETRRVKSKRQVTREQAERYRGWRECMRNRDEGIAWKSHRA